MIVDGAAFRSLFSAVKILRVSAREAEMAGAGLPFRQYGNAALNSLIQIYF